MVESNTTRVAVIMAGGSGERFWPLSRRLRPKQLLPLSGTGRSLLAESVSRVTPIIPAENVYVATGEHLVDTIRAAGIGVPDENVLAEPCKRNTAGCLAYAAAHILARHASTDAPVDSAGLHRRFTMAVLTADHVIGESEKFRRTVEALLDAAEQEHALGVIGVVPTRPETGYGYIEAKLSDRLNTSSKDVTVYRVAAFHEKPDEDKARAFMRSGSHFWNAGMFFWNIADFMRELGRVRPDIAEAVVRMANALGDGDERRVRAIFEALPDIAIDYALMEHAQNVIVARAEFPWDDIGSWPALERTHARDEEGNILVGQPIVVGSKNCIVYQETGPDEQDVAVAVVGADNLVVVVTGDAVLVMPKERAQDVRLAVSELVRRGAKQT